MAVPQQTPALRFEPGSSEVKKQKKVAFAAVEVREETTIRLETIRVQTWPRVVADHSREIELEVEPNIHRPKGKVVEQGGVVTYVTEVFFYMRNFNFFPLAHY
ncbi:hypothetical protein Daus18300_005594 [Diaporthe australafricana]|uniref:Uncharacterized protein n=1 Tax=Diaporthe australafricana TaxID=127596 RepID=A0ABR3X112_9PEZI